MGVICEETKAISSQLLVLGEFVAAGIAWRMEPCTIMSSLFVLCVCVCVWLQQIKMRDHCQWLINKKNYTPKACEISCEFSKSCIGYLVMPSEACICLSCVGNGAY